MEVIVSTPFLFSGIMIVLIYDVYALAKKKSAGRTVLISIFSVYVMLVISITLFPMIITPGTRQSGGLVQPVPFYTINEILNSGNEGNIIRQIYCNIIMTIPYGIMIPFLMNMKKRYQYFLNMLAFPVVIEMSQYIVCILLDSHYRVVDIDDVILNALGVLTGYIIYKFLPEKVKTFFTEKDKKFI